MEQTPLLAIASLGVGYVCGMLPTGVWLARGRGVNLRQSGSGNVGATNVLRTVGVGLGVATLLGDVAKAALPTWLVGLATGRIELASLAGMAAVVGHCYPATDGFDGGKGVASALGALLVLTPTAAGVAVVVFALAVGATRIVSVGSLAGATIGFAAVAVVAASPTVVAAVGLMVAVVWLRHRANLQRLCRGTEPKLASLKKGASA